ncbi:MAG: biotin/lipoyl-binding protein [Paludibacteraceae bacterium]|nr:biotin/lipoyl-binding protein [Paludibacteraceae bacterium]MBR1480783.1 biotin/lipoyl-binding protein [Paludibacteraceae bacterium]
MKQFKFVINGHKYETAVNEIAGNMAEVTVNGTTFQVEIEKEEAVAAPRRSAVQAASQVVNAAQQSAGVQAVKSPLPGSIVKVNVHPGDKVNVGDELLTMESMKMENSIKAEVAGTVKAVLVEPGKNVMQDDKLLEIETVAVAAAPKAAPAPAPKPEAPKAAPAAPKAAPAAPAAGAKVVSPLPGSVIKVLVTEGQAVKKGDTLLTLESMKMENAVMAEQDGTVKQICVSAGQNVMQDDLLMVLG